MKVYAICKECEDTYYGYLKPDKVFKDKNKASEYVVKMAEDYLDYSIFEYELE